tara:strand:+ start:168 stop:710 length:543 start_codon:yes stop_codon:yes gene_type:complete
MCVLKKYNSKNFFKHTFCEFQQVDDFEIPTENNYKSKAESEYFYTKKGVYRKSNHWGRVANCRWRLTTKKAYKNQETVIGFAKWSEFYPINSVEKIFRIAVDFENKKVQISPIRNKSAEKKYTFSEAQKKVKQIEHLFKSDKWAAYFNAEIEYLRKKLITAFVNSNKELRILKNELKQEI